ncbi:MAG: hypothetical protein Q4D23_11175, partial [Bacteroidales bacterium]|nr:hypothetical protein [Bacteroidales bacterium]
FLVLLYNSYEIISNIAATAAGLPRSLWRAVSITGGPVSRLRVQRYGDFSNCARKTMKKGEYLWETRLFVTPEIAKRGNKGVFEGKMGGKTGKAGGGGRRAESAARPRRAG